VDRNEQQPLSPPAPWTRAAARRATWTGVARSLGLVLATVAFGLGLTEGERRLREPAAAAVPARPASDTLTPMEPPAAPTPRPEPEIWLVDGFNVLHAGVLKGRDRAGWWTAPVQLRLLERIARFEPLEAELWVVFDAAHPTSERCAPGPELARVKLVFAASADDWLVRRARQSESPDRLAVVTGDRQVGGRVRHAGAQIVSPRIFLARCPVPTQGPEPGPA
jgi:predicted RNA-binding protein with PIN domain